MQRKAVLLVLGLVVALVGCRIPDEHYTRIRDGAVESDGAIDAPSSNALTRGYLFDFQTGIYQLAKNPQTGDLTLVSASPTPAMGASTMHASSGTTNKEGTHLYALVGSSKQILDFAISPTGALTQQAVTAVAPCTPASAKVHPGGKFLAIGCSNADIAVVPIRTDGSLGTPVVTAAGMIPSNLAFTPNGSCLYFADLNGATASRVLNFQFNAATGVVTPNGAAPGPSAPRGLAVHPGGMFAYVAGNGTIQRYSIAATCELTPMTSTPIGTNTTQVTIDPQGTHAFVTGTEVYVFNIDATGALSGVAGNPFFMAGTPMDGTTMDPEVPDRLYITARGYSGTHVISIAADGSLAQISTLTVGNGGDTWMQLAP